MAALKIKMFGETHVVDGDRVVGPRDFGGVKPRQVLEVLALHAGHPVSKDTLIEALWGERAGGASTANLEAYVSVLRRRIEPDAPTCSSVVRTTNGGYLLDPDLVDIDFHEFRQMIAGTRSAPAAQGQTDLRKALALVEADLLESEPYAPWAMQARTTVHVDIVDACERASLHALAVGQWSEAIALARRALRLDPLAEGCARALIEALWRDGRRGDALRAYEALRRSLADDLGTDPDERTQALHLKILRGEGGDGPAASRAASKVLVRAQATLDDEAPFERLVREVVRTVSGARSTHQICIESLMSRITAELVAS